MGGPTSFATLNAGFAIDATQLVEFGNHFNQLSQHFGPIFKKVAPTFGAYMRYSAVLEFGWRDKRMANFRVRGGSTVASDSGIPHIYPAIRKNMQYIVMGLLNSSVKPFAEAMVSSGKGKSSTSSNAQLVILERTWGRLLNDKPRQDAVNRAPYRYGFHRRSIQGSAYEISADEITRMRIQAAQGYAKAYAKLKAKSLAKKRGGHVLKPVDL